MKGVGDYPQGLENVFGSDVMSGRTCHMRIELDYPTPGVSVLRSAVYVDRKGWLAEAFRYRSYPHPRMDLPAVVIPSSSGGTAAVVHLMSTELNWHSRDTHEPVAEDDYRDWDPCLFHALFRPNPRMEKQLELHQSRIRKGDDEVATVAIHFRVGDGISFPDAGIPNDVRMDSDKSLRTSWNQMKDCARELARTAFPTFAAAERVRYVLATDNMKIKNMAREDVDMDVYVTEVTPSSFRHASSRDSDAWMELFLLSRQDGFVMNGMANPEAYEGPADKISTFAKLVLQIGFFFEGQVMVCHI
eukprot:CAMPEP_0172488390 /NCGR_PEP_ID=MMETSP1066-20121228/17886_1 /TAXON_ID=671091 /ORGANISM="Coscinodiscus wailesii, Strain CCMP2513" /LENGTH=301 /DNA_ID=CAMNT_0013255571 /DNA_START=360 /DNA_END=1265 /DNA_ORIENTATION=-